jgi:hypothetical protein
MVLHFAIDDDARFIHIQKSEELKTRVKSHDDGDHDDQPSFYQEKWIVLNSLPSSVNNADVFVKVLVLFPEILKVKLLQVYFQKVNYKKWIYQEPDRLQDSRSHARFWKLLNIRNLLFCFFVQINVIGVRNHDYSVPEKLVYLCFNQLNGFLSSNLSKNHNKKNPKKSNQ